MAANRTYFFPTPPVEMPDFTSPRVTVRALGLGERHEDYVRERVAQAKYPASMLAILYAAGEITKEQYQRLRMERA